MTEATRQRKAALILAGIQARQVARLLGYHESVVARVVSGRYLTGPAAERVMAYVALVTNKPVAELWPETVKPVEVGAENRHVVG